ncbi:MAG TPA: hypothetical protein VHH88_11875, partial [Verrucomicrobiae bacterium]|nr:hypothetical protein [Verrucomicrobiae bacterium]
MKARFLFGVNIAVCLAAALFARPAQAACISTPIRKGQDPQVALIAGTYYLAQSDGCNVHLRSASTLAGLS